MHKFNAEVSAIARASLMLGVLTEESGDATRVEIANAVLRLYRRGGFLMFNGKRLPLEDIRVVGPIVRGETTVSFHIQSIEHDCDIEGGEDPVAGTDAWPKDRNAVRFEDAGDGMRWIAHWYNRKGEQDIGMFEGTLQEVVNDPRWGRLRRIVASNPLPREHAVDALARSVGANRAPMET